MGNTYIFDDSHDYTGAVATFTDTHGTSRITNISVPLSPIQDLHGYDHPWPAGGGVNKYPIAVGEDNFTNNGSATHSNDNGSLKIVTNASGSASGVYCPANSEIITAVNTYTFPLTVSMDIVATASGSVRFVFCGSQDLLTIGTTKQRVSITATSNSQKNFNIYGVNNGATLTVSNLQIEEGSSASPYSPYSNICPITGRTGLSVYDDPKYGGTVAWNQIVQNGNFADGTNKWAPNYGTYNSITTENGELNCKVLKVDGDNNYSIAVRQNKTIPENHVVLISAEFKPMYSHSMGFYFIRDTTKYPSGQNTPLYKPCTAGQWNVVSSVTKLALGNAVLQVQFDMRDDFGYAVDDVDLCRNINLYDLTQMFGSTIADYIYGLEQANTGAGVAWFRNLFPKPYYSYNAGETTCVSAVNGDPYWKKDIDWTTPAGTVYGGTLDVVSGLLTVDRVYFTDKWKNGAGATSLGSYTRRIFTHAVKSKYPNYVKKPICNVAKYKAAFAEDSLHFYVNSTTSSNIIVFLPNDTDGETDIQVCYELATPLTYQLTAQEVSVIKNSLNNVWASTGSSITVTVKDIAYGFQGWLVKVGSSLTLVPTEMIEAESYKVTPDQRMEESAERDTTGYLWRDTVRNTPPKIEFNTPPVNNTQVAALNAIFQSAFTVKSQRKLQVAFFDPEDDCYKIWDCYMPDVEYPMHLIDPDAKTILYDSIRYAFIGY